MKDERKRAVFRDCLRRFRLPALVFFLQAVLSLAVFLLYELPAEPFLYALAVTGFLLLLLFAGLCWHEQKSAARRQETLAAILTRWNELPPPENLSEADYGEMIARLGAEAERISAEFYAGQRQTQDFYTSWVHQIKTPIAVMRLALGSPEEPDRRALEEQLFRIEQYTDMVLAFQRLGSSVNDLLVEEYDLDELIRPVLRKLAPQFIYKKLKLEYAGTDLRLVTDKKWFQCILEQLISNAVKYTPAGSVTVSVEDGILSVADTGIGIAPEDLPRIFEKGYTGANGRLNDHSSGLGLYLCGKAAQLLNLPLRAESTPGQGSRFTVDLREKIQG